MSTEKAHDTAADLERRIDAIESGYEFLLAYAAQGRKTDKGPGEGGKLRGYLDGMERALGGLGAAVRARAADRLPASLDGSAAFYDAIDDDAAKAAGAIRLVIAQSDISSQLVDNLNASIHLRALLTDLFVIDEALKPSRAG